MRVFITGGTGLVGQRLVRAFQQRGDRPVVLSRRADFARQQFGPAVEVVQGDPMQAGSWMDAVGGCDGVVNLAGENIFARRWNDSFKQLLLDSRVQVTRHVAEALARAPANGHPRVLVSASAIGYYGPHGDEELTESSPPGDDFLSKVCVQWEKAAVVAGARCVVVRIGVVLDPAGGALAKMLTPFKLFTGGPVAGGRQWMSWIHHADMTGLLLFALDRSDVQGPLNASAPNPVTNRQFAKALGRAIHRPSFFPTPAFLLRLGLGEVAGVIATGQRVLPRRPMQLGYQFRHSTIDGALADLFAPPPTTPAPAPRTVPGENENEE
jgi:uncharacterized protein (TIGR01777 family)